MYTSIANPRQFCLRRSSVASDDVKLSRFLHSNCKVSAFSPTPSSTHPASWERN